MEEREFGAALSESTIRSMVTEDINWFVEQIEKEERIPDKILISPFIPEGLEPASYDIHLGEKYLSHMTGKIENLREGDKLIIKPGETVNIESLEYIGLPQDITALITSRTDLVMKGLSQMSTHIDPGFHGKLFQTLVNLSNRDIMLNYGDPIAHVTFFKVSGAKPQLRYKRRPRLGQKSLDEDPIKKEVENNPGSIMRPPYLELLVPGFIAIPTIISMFIAYSLGNYALGNLLAVPSILSILALSLRYYVIKKGK